jgi:hypothetical protein
LYQVFFHLIWYYVSGYLLRISDELSSAGDSTAAHVFAHLFLELLEGDAVVSIDIEEMKDVLESLRA